MQTEQVSNGDFLNRMRAAGEKYSARQSMPKPAPKPKQKKLSPFLETMREAGQKFGGYKHDKRRWRDLSDEEKKATCTRTSGKYGLRKKLDGLVERVPLHCNLCEKCYAANAKKLKDKVGAIAEHVSDKPGQWRKKVVDEETEAQSLKKHIKRNQAGRHMELACDQPGQSEIWCYVEDEPGKDMDEIYGEVASPKDIDFDALYERNRSTGKKMSVGKAFKRGSAGSKKDEDTMRVQQYEIIVKDVGRQDEAEQIIHQVNYIEEASTAEKVEQLYTYQIKFIIKALEEVGIEIAAINSYFYNIAKQDIINQWNMNVKHWMSINASLPKDKEANVDTKDNPGRLVFPKTSKPVVN
jgi:hypothetical protein